MIKETHGGKWRMGVQWVVESVEPDMNRRQYATASESLMKVCNGSLRG